MPTTKYQIKQNSAHIVIIKDDKNVLIDTGSPQTIGKMPEFEWNGVKHKISESMLGMVDIHEVCELSGEDIDVLLGADILGASPFMVDLKENCFILPDGDYKTPDGEEFPLEIVMGIPLTEIMISGMKGMSAIDSGAIISYVVSSHWETGTFKTLAEDFHPAIGKYKTMTGELPVKIGGIGFNATFGVLPEIFEMTLSMIDADSIIGKDLFRERVVYLDYSNERMIISI